MKIKLSAGIPGYCNEYYSWESIVESLPQKGTLLEVGSGCGLSAVTFAEKFAETNRDYTIHTVDIFKGVSIVDKTYTGDQQKKYLDRILDSWDNISYTECDFFKREWDVPTVFFYDGEHSYDSTLKALQMMQEAEVILVDDYTKHFPDVKKAVEYFAEEADKELTVFESLWTGCARLTNR